MGQPWLYPELISISAVRDAAGQVQHYVGVSTDIGQLKAHESALHQMANYDILTGLPNRRLLGDRLDQALARSQRTGRALAVAYIDLDSFKAVNDAHGHAVGDQLLVQMAERLKGVLRGDDTLARLGGDEFVLLFSDLDSPDACHALARQALAAIATPVLVDGAEIHTTASLGLTLFPQDAADADTLLRHADQAMYLAKEAGKNSHVVFDPIHVRQVQAHREQLHKHGECGLGKTVLATLDRDHRGAHRRDRDYGPRSASFGFRPTDHPLCHGLRQEERAAQVYAHHRIEGVRRQFKEISADFSGYAGVVDEDRYRSQSRLN